MKYITTIKNKAEGYKTLSACALVVVTVAAYVVGIISLEAAQGFIALEIAGAIAGLRVAK